MEKQKSFANRNKLKDSFGREINYLRLSVTDLCNLRCQYCMPEDGIKKIPHKDMLTFEEVDTIIANLVELGIKKIRITGGEPLVKKGIVSLIEKISSHKEIEDLTLTTNGLLLGEKAEQLKKAGLNRVNISIDSLKKDNYFKITRGGNVEDVMKGLEAAKRNGLTPIKLNVVLMKGYNDDEIEDFIELTKENEIDVRFIELMPIGELSKSSHDRYLPNDYVLEKVPELEKVKTSDSSSPAVYYKLPNAKGKVGLISPISCNFCADCNRIRVTADGVLKYCLHSDEEFDLKRVVREGEDLKQYIIKSIEEKPEKHKLDSGEHISRGMSQVGG